MVPSDFGERRDNGTKGEAVNEPATMTADLLEKALARAVRHPHKHVHRGKIVLAPEIFRTPGLETNVAVSPFCLLDCTGSIRIGPWCNIGHRARIYTHDTIHLGRRPLAQVELEYGVLWQDKFIGADVWIHDGAIVLYQVTTLPDGVVVGAGAVLTRNPGPYEIWAGNPARKIGERRPMDETHITAALAARPRFRLDKATTTDAG